MMSDEIQLKILKELKKITEILLCDAEERDMERVTKKRFCVDMTRTQEEKEPDTTKSVEFSDSGYWEFGSNQKLGSKLLQETIAEMDACREEAYNKMYMHKGDF